MRFSMVLCILLVWTVAGISQEHAMVWYFGNKAGLDFNEGTPLVLTNSEMVAEAGCSVICDEQGHLLFYTNGNRVWNANHEVMVNGQSLNGSQKLNQNSVIVPLPGSNSIYYLFTVIDADTMNHFYYSIVDMSLQNGLGEILQKNIPVLEDVVEKIAAVQHCNAQDFWILVHGNDATFYAYLLTASGLDQDFVPSTVGTRPRASIGYLKVSPAANKVVMPVNDENLLAEVFHFDNEMGLISDPLKIWSTTENTYCYGVEYSADGNLLYISTGGRDYGLWQYNLGTLNEAQLNQSAIKIASGNNYALQLAPNGSIYIAAENRPWLNAIMHPEMEGIACNYSAKAIDLDENSSLMGLPNFVQSWLYHPGFDVDNTCVDDTAIFRFFQPDNLDSIVWVFGDGSGKTAYPDDQFYTAHEYMQTGLFDIVAKGFHCGSVSIATQQTEVFPKPQSDLVSDTVICSGCSLVLDAGDGFTSYLWNDGSPYQWITVYGSGIYSVEVSRNGCLNTDFVNVLEVNPVLVAPNAFTPNGDGLNDEFILVSNKQMDKFTLWILDRGGTIVFVSTSIRQGWDGRFKGQLCPMQTYAWFAEIVYEDEKGVHVETLEKGVITLLQ